MAAARWLAAVALAAHVSMLLPLAAAEAPVAEQAVRHLEIDYQAAVEPLPSSAKMVDLWLPIPSDGPGQEVQAVEVVVPAEGTMAVEPKFGNRIFHHRYLVQPGAAAPAAQIRLVITRKPFSAPLPQTLVNASASEVPRELDVYLAASQMIPLEGPIAKLSDELALPPGEPLVTARKIYDAVLERMTYNWTAKGAGHGDTLWACDSRTGDCTDYHSMFIALCRSHGIPADHEFGPPIKPGARQGKATFCHCWARFWVPEIGWVPVDASEADKHPELREFNFGSWSTAYIRLAHGRDVTLVPPQAAGPLNMLHGPYAEIDGQPVEKVKWSMTWREVDDAP